MKNFKRWYEMEARTSNIGNCRAYMRSMSFFNKKSFIRMCLLTGDNRDAFEKMFGKADSHYSNGEYGLAVWVRNFDGEKFILFSAAGKGTCIEICNTDFNTVNNKSDAIIKFTDYLIKEIGKYKTISL